LAGPTQTSDYTNLQSAHGVRWDQLAAQRCTPKVQLLGAHGQSIVAARSLDKACMSVHHSHELASAIRIGIVDDDYCVRKAIGRLLRVHGYSSIVYESAEAALADPQLLLMHCLVVDIQLGGIDGFEFCGRIEALGSHIPHVFITAYVQPESSEVADGRSKEILLIKPFDEGELLTSIERAMANPRP
jgi:CheY-like chemotaxis protein